MQSDPGYYKACRPLTPEEYEGLKASIQQHGILNDVLVDKHGNIVDGYHRAQIAKELGISYQAVVLDGTPAELRAKAITVNLHRRQLTAEDRAALVVELKKQGKTNVAVAKSLGVDETTVRRDLKSVSANAETDLPTTVTRSDGKSYPATKPNVVPLRPDVDVEVAAAAAKPIPQVPMETRALALISTLEQFGKVPEQGADGWFSTLLEYSKRIIEEHAESGQWETDKITAALNNGAEMVAAVRDLWNSRN